VKGAFPDRTNRDIADKLGVLVKTRASGIIRGSSDFGVINKIFKKQYDMPINHFADYKIITTFSFL